MRTRLQKSPRRVSRATPAPCICLAALLASTFSAFADESGLDYELRFEGRGGHVIEVSASVPARGRKHIELLMATWTPGSYLIREYARHVEGLHASAPDGTSRAVEKIAKNRWRVAVDGAERVRFEYRLYCREMSVRSNWVDDEVAILNGAPTFLTVDGELERPHRVKLNLPEHWSRSVTALPLVEGAGPNEYIASDYDTLVDSPIIAGRPAVYPFEVEGKLHSLVNVGEGGLWDGAAAARDVERIVRETHALWRTVPYERYLFLNMITESGGGLEHSDSTLMMASRWAYRDRKRYKIWLGLVSHEFFHTWNVKELRPRELASYDYENEVLLRTLWIAEGVTSYYDDIILARAGLLSRDEYLERLSKNIERLQITPGRLEQSLAASSFDTWIKFYRPDENSSNVSISYYTKGSVVAFLLDAEIRRASSGKRSLDDVMRRVYESRRTSGFSPAEFRASASEVAGKDLRPWFIDAVDKPVELDYAPALEWFGLTFEPAKAKKKDDASGAAPADAGGDDTEKASASEAKKKAWLGITTETANGRLQVKRVLRDTPAFTAGLNVGDEIIAIGDYRVTSTQWSARLEQYRPGDREEVLVARRGRLLRLPIVFGAKPDASWKLRVRDDASDEQKARLAAWLAASEARGAK